jgi:uncharacterized protein YyaL (SSP411 family)
MVAYTVLPSFEDQEREARNAAVTPRPSNRLARESSAYLRQHMHNPVDWYPWGPEALERARSEDRPLLVSIGYSACHWCHVMERESFEDPETAALMNRLFVNVKIDREERPDLDQIYMDTVTGLTGHGGWPLTVFCTPDGAPFYGGTYFPPEPRHGLPSFREVLSAIGDAYRERREEVAAQARQVVQALAQRPDGVAESPPGVETALRAARGLLLRADPQHGGFGGAPKFPTPANLLLLLAASELLPGPEARAALDHVLLSCREMAWGGVYDQLGGAFHRYSVDAHWGVPHFEKMLYDQGQLLSVYAEAWRLGGDDALLVPVRETVAYLRSELRGPEGAFYASVDADSEGEEGTFYVWTPEQVAAVLGPERAAAFCRAYDVTPPGNFEAGRSVLRDLERGPRERFAAERSALHRERACRPAPAVDRKRVAAWNGLAISGLARAAEALDDPSLLSEAAHAADFVFARMRDAQGRVLRVFDGEQARISGFLDDVAALLAAALDLHRAGAGDHHLTAALELAEDVVRRFFDPSLGDLFLTPADAEPLVQRPRSDFDGATPHSTGLAVLGLLRAASVSGRGGLREVAERVLRTHAFALERGAEAFPTLARAASLAERGASLAVVVGEPGAPDTRALAARARRVLAPEDAVLVAAPGARPEGIDPSWLEGREPNGGRATAWVCRGVTCSLPVTHPDALQPLPPGGAR